MAKKQNRFVRTQVTRTSFFETYCGKTFGPAELGVGFLAGAGGGFLIGFLLFHNVSMEVVLAVCFGWYCRKAYAVHLKKRRKQDFLNQFCDYLDSVSTSLAVGRNGYESFLTAEEDMKELYRKDTPICYVSGKMAEGLRNGRSIPELLEELSEETECSSVQTFGEVYRICSNAGGNLKLIVGDTRNMLTEKIAVEQEIQTVLTGPKNELNIMVLMPLIILLSLRVMGGGLLDSGEDLFGVNLLVLGIFVGAYMAGRKIVNIEV